MRRLSALVALATGALSLEAAWRPTRTPGPSARSGACASADAAGALHVFGGYLEAADGSRRVSNDLWRFADGEWTEVAAASDDAPRPRLCATLSSTTGGLLLLGGWDPGSRGDGGDILDDVWLFENGRWTQLDARLPGPRSRHAACALDDGRVVAVTHRDVLVYDPSTRAVAKQETTGPAPSSRGLHVAAKLDGTSSVVVWGGADQSGAMCDDAFVLDCDAWAWRALAARGPAPRAGAAAAPLGPDAVLLVGGALRDAASGGLSPSDEVWVLDVAEDEWRRLAPANPELFEARNAHVLGRVGPGAFVLHGGWQPFVRSFDTSLALDLAE